MATHATVKPRAHRSSSCACSKASRILRALWCRRRILWRSLSSEVMLMLMLLLLASTLEDEAIALSDALRTAMLGSG